MFALVEPASVLLERCSNWRWRGPGTCWQHGEGKGLTEDALSEMNFGLLPNGEWAGRLESRFTETRRRLRA